MALYANIVNDNFHQVRFDHSKHPGTEFEIVSLEQIMHRKDLDHDHLSSHQIEFYALIVITNGEGKHSIDYVEYPYKQGTVLTVRKDQIHSFHPSSAKGYLLIFTEEFVISFLENLGIQKVKEVFNELLFPQSTKLPPEQFEECTIILNQISKEFNQYADSHSRGVIRNLLQVLISKIYRARNSENVEMAHKYIERFLELQKLIEENCKRSRAVQFYADQLNVTTKTLNNITNQVVKKSAKTLIDEILILQIKRQLINSNLTIKEIAFSSGFEEPTNLFKFFKRFSNQTPEQFRANQTVQN